MVRGIGTQPGRFCAQVVYLGENPYKTVVYRNPGEDDNTAYVFERDRLTPDGHPFSLCRDLYHVSLFLQEHGRDGAPLFEIRRVPDRVLMGLPRRVIPAEAPTVTLAPFRPRVSRIVKGRRRVTRPRSGWASFRLTWRVPTTHLPEEAWWLALHNGVELRAVEAAWSASIWFLRDRRGRLTPRARRRPP